MCRIPNKGRDIPLVTFPTSNEVDKLTLNTHIVADNVSKQNGITTRVDLQGFTVPDMFIIWFWLSG